MDKQKIIEYIECTFTSKDLGDSSLSFFSTPFTPLNQEEILLKESIFFFNSTITYIKENSINNLLGYFLVKKNEFLITRLKISSGCFRSIEDKEYFEKVNKENREYIKYLEKEITVSPELVDNFLKSQVMYGRIKKVLKILSELYQKGYTYFPNQTIDLINIEDDKSGKSLDVVNNIICLIAIVFIFINIIVALILFIIVGFIGNITKNPEKELQEEKNKDIQQKNKWYKEQVSKLVTEINYINYYLHGVKEGLIMTNEYLISDYINIYNLKIEDYKKILEHIKSFLQ